MITTEAILVMATCLIVIAAIGVRIALSLRDIEKSLDRVAEALERTQGPGGGLSRGRSAGAKAVEASATASVATEAEVAAAIAAAARFAARPPARPAATAPRKGTPDRPGAGQGAAYYGVEGDVVVDATAERKEP